ncbi:MAG: hypothetical protein IKC08_02405 [Lentisphaeria bacterium]|nr:hypothetical protein [Lentisphaeria bacterium]
MIPKAIQEKYSCKRKKDYVTGFAIIFFLLVVCFEIYVVLWMPVQIQRKNMLEVHTAKDELIRNFDNLRHQCFKLYFSRKDSAKGEVELTIRVLDMYAIYLRNNVDLLSISELIELKRTFGRFEALAMDWEQGKYCFSSKKFDLAPALAALEEKNRL